jgi:hypothetical protein
MTNNLVLPLLALVLTILAAFFPFQREDEPPPDWRRSLRDTKAGFLITGASLLLFAAAVLIWPGVFKGGSSVAVAAAVGAIVAALAAAGGPGRSGFAVGMAVLGTSLLHLLSYAGVSEAVGATQVAFLVGAFVAAFATGGVPAKSSGGYLCALAAVPIISVDFLGRMKVPGSDSAASSGVVLGLAFLVAALVAGVIGRASSKAVARSLAGIVLLAAVGYLASWKYLGNSDLGNLWLGGIAVGAVVNFIMAGEAEPEPFRFILATVIWLGAATVAFGMNLGYGMAVSLLGGVCALVVFGNVRALMTLAVVLSVLVYRLFRELFPEEAKAPDIGQHYTMIGIAIGALLPLLPVEWAKGRSLGGARSAIAASLWLLILLGLPVAASVLLGSKGAIGMVIGLGFAAVVEGLRGVASLAPVGIATGLGALTVLTYGWLGDWTDLERAVKIRAVIVVSVVILVLAALLFGVSREKASDVPAEQ